MRAFRTRTNLIFLFGAVTLVFLASLLNLFRLNYDLGETFVRESKKSKVAQLRSTIELHGIGLKTAVNDYSWWDEMIAFAAKPEGDWGHENFAVCFKSFHTHGAWLFDADAKLVFSKAADDVYFLVQDTCLAAAINLSLSQVAFGRFFFVSNSLLVEIRTAPLHSTSDTNRSAAPRGYLAIADIWDESRLSQLAGDMLANMALRFPNKQSGADEPYSGSDSPDQFEATTPLYGIDSTVVAYLDCTYTSHTYAELLDFDKQLVISIWLFSTCIMVFLIAALTKWVSQPLDRIMSSLEEGRPDRLAGLGRVGSDFQRIAQLVRDFFVQRKDFEDQIAIQRETELALRAVEDQLRREMQTTELVLQSAGEGICGLDAEGRVTFINHAASEMLGWSSDELLGRSLHELAHHTSIAGRPLSKEESLVYRSYRLGQVHRSSSESCWRKDGSHIPVEIVSAPIMRDNEPIGAVVIFRDLTERKKVEEQLGKLWLAVEQSPTSIVITDTKGNIENVNPKFLEVSGYTVDEVIGQTPRLLKSGVHPKEFYTELWSTLKDGRIWRGEFCNRKKSGELYWELCAIAPVRNMLGEVTHFVAVKEDVTMRKSAERQIQEAKEAAETANRAKSSFLASMSHEIRTPMNSILGYTQLLARDAELGKQSRQYVEIVNRSGEHLLELINDILEMSKIESGRMTVEKASFDLSRLIDDLDAMFRVRAESKQLIFTAIKNGRVHHGVVSDEGKIRQMLINLLGNAIKFTSRGGVTLRTEIVATSDKTGILVAEVEDTGVGIAEAELPRLFTRFEQSESGRKVQSGTGLGLAISREYARLLDGDISVTSEQGVGSCFHLEVPIDFDAEAKSVQRAMRRKILGIKTGETVPKVLVVDDNRQNRGWLVAILTEIGFETREAEDGKEALESWKSWRPQLILMDVHMSVMDGIESTRQIRASLGGADVVIIGVSASAFKNDAQAAMAAGMDDFASKPLKLEDLFDKIGQHLSMKYVYGDEAPGETGIDAAVTATRLSGENLADLPIELIMSLREATLNGDVEQMAEIIKVIEKSDWAVADALGTLVEQFDYDAILEITQLPLVRF